VLSKPRPAFSEVTEFCDLLTDSVGLVADKIYQLVILVSAGDALSCGCGDESTALYNTVDDSDTMCSLRQAIVSVPLMLSTKA
jgi:hypothetical protein